MPSERFQRNPRSVSWFGADDEQRGSIGKTIVVEDCLLPFESHREKPVGQIRCTPAQHANRINLILGEAFPDQICDHVGHIEWAPIKTVGELRGLEVAKLEDEFGRYGLRLYKLARGIDENHVVADRPTKSISVEDTFQEDVLLAETEPMIRRLVEKLWLASRNESRTARTVVLKLKTSGFKILTRSCTPDVPLSSREELSDIALKLRARVNLPPHQRYRLVGVGLSNFRDAELSKGHPFLFE